MVAISAVDRLFTVALDATSLFQTSLSPILEDINYATAMFCCELAVCCKHKISRWHHQFIWHLNNYPSLIGFNGGRWLDVCSSSLKFFASPACCVILICSHIFQRATQSTHFWPDLSRCSHDSGSKHILYSMLFCVSFWGEKKTQKSIE